MKYLSYIDYRNKTPVSTRMAYEQFIARYAPYSWFKDNNNQLMRPFLSSDEEKDLWDKYIASKKKDIGIRNIIVERYMWVVYYTAKTLFIQNRMNMTLDDVISESSLKLIKLVENFDPSFDNLFITYAIDSIVHHVQCVNNIRYGDFKISYLMHSRRVRIYALLESGILSISDMCDKTSLTTNLAIYFKLKPSVTTVKHLVCLINDMFNSVCSLNAPVTNPTGETTEVTLMELLSSVDTDKSQTVFSQNIETLERLLVYLRYGIDTAKPIPEKYAKRVKWFSKAIEDRLFCSIGVERDVNTGLYMYTKKKTYREIGIDTGYSKQAVEQWINHGLMENIFSRYDKTILKEVFEEILRGDTTFERAKLKIENFKEKSI